MFIIWGTNRTERTLGFVADYCPVCHDPRAFKLIRVGLVSHLYFISFGAGKLVEHLIRCEKCGVDFKTEPTRYSIIEKQCPNDLDQLEHTTFPSLRATYATELALVAKFARSSHTLLPEERRKLLIEPFQFLHSAVEKRYYNGTEMDKPAAIGMLATVLGTAAIVGGAIYFQDTMSDTALVASAAVFGIGGLYTMIQIHLAPGRFMRSQIVPKLARSLDRLRPEESELTDCLKRCREIGWKIGKKVKARQILDEIQRRDGALQKAA